MIYQDFNLNLQNGFDIKSHNNNPEELIKCIRYWFSETVGLRDVNSSKKIYSDFINFNTNLFDKKLKKYLDMDYSETESEELAKSEIDEISIPEFIDEIKIFLKKDKS